MEVAYVSALSALAGSIVGGLTTGYTNWLSQRAQVRAGRLEHDLGRRQDLLREFAAAAAKAYGDAMVHNEPNIAELVDLYAMISRMRILAMPRSVACAEALMRKIVETYFEPNWTARSFRDLLESNSPGVDPLREFSEAAREELSALAPY
jgi:hypothetical protein